jgi:hypothetical protein
MAPELKRRQAVNRSGEFPASIEQPGRSQSRPRLVQDTMADVSLLGIALGSA